MKRMVANFREEAASIQDRARQLQDQYHAAPSDAAATAMQGMAVSVLIADVTELCIYIDVHQHNHHRVLAVELQSSHDALRTLLQQLNDRIAAFKSSQRTM